MAVSRAVLDVACIVPTSHQAGQLGWSLYYEHPRSRAGYRLISEGNDLHHRGRVIWYSPLLFPPGFYVLHARRYEPFNLVPLADDQVSWSVTEQTNQLSAGYEGDIQAPLDLH